MLDSFGGSIGAQLKRWHDAWHADEELRFKYPRVEDYTYLLLRELYDKSPSFRAEYPEYKTFKTTAKQEASRLFAAERERMALAAVPRKGVATRVKDALGRL